MMISVGHHNYVRSELVATILKANTSAAKKLRKAAQEKGVLIDATAGHKTRSVLVLGSGQIILCALQAETARNRLSKSNKEIEASTTVPDHWLK